MFTHWWGRNGGGGGGGGGDENLLKINIMSCLFSTMPLNMHSWRKLSLIGIKKGGESS